MTMQRMLIALTLLVALVVVGTSVPSLGGEESKALIDVYTEIWMTGELDKLDSIVTEDFKRHPSANTTTRSLGELKEAIILFRQMYPDLKATVKETVIENGKAAIWWTMTGTHKELGKKMERSGMCLFRFADGKIAEEWVFVAGEGSVPSK